MKEEDYLVNNSTNMQVETILSIKNICCWFYLSAEFRNNKCKCENVVKVQNIIVVPICFSISEIICA